MVHGKKEIFLDSGSVLRYNSVEGFLSHVDRRGTGPRTTEHEGIMGGMNDANAYPYEKLQIVERQRRGETRAADRLFRREQFRQKQSLANAVAPETDY